MLAAFTIGHHFSISAVYRGKCQSLDLTSAFGT
jgi:hypothetical protein